MRLELAIHQILAVMVAETNLKGKSCCFPLEGQRPKDKGKESPRVAPPTKILPQVAPPKKNLPQKISPQLLPLTKNIAADKLRVLKVKKAAVFKIGVFLRGRAVVSP